MWVISSQYFHIFFIADSDQADLCAEPLDVFKFMQSNRIGEYNSTFYEAMAIVLESKASFSSAEGVYKKGIKMYDPL